MIQDRDPHIEAQKSKWTNRDDFRRFYLDLQQSLLLDLLLAEFLV